MKAVKPINTPDDPYLVKKIGDSEVRYVSLMFKGNPYELRELTASQCIEVTDIYTEVGFLHASGFTGAGEINLDDMYSKVANPKFMIRFLAACIVTPDGNPVDPSVFTNCYQRELTALYREVFGHFFSLNLSLFENMGLGLSLGPVAEMLRKAVSQSGGTPISSIASATAIRQRGR